MKVFITGVSSFFASMLKNSLENTEIIPIKSKTNRDSDSMDFDKTFLNLIDEDSYIIHAAWNMSNRKVANSKKINVEGTHDFFFSLDKKFQNQFIFVSSVGASKYAQSTYGKHKQEVEEIILANKGMVLKCGLLIDENNPYEYGFFSNLYKLAKKAPIIPNFSGNKAIYQVTRINDIKKAFKEITTIKESKVYESFDQSSYSFKDLVQGLMNLDKKVVNFPWFIGYFVSKFFEIIKIDFAVKSDSLLGIREMQKRFKHEKN